MRRIIVYSDITFSYRWRLFDENGQLICQGEPMDNRIQAENDFHQTAKAFREASVKPWETE